MDGRSRHLHRTAPHQPAFQLKPGLRFLPPGGSNGAQNNIRRLPPPKGGGGSGLPRPLPPRGLPGPGALLRLPKLGPLGLAFGLGFAFGDAVLNPFLGQPSLFDWGFLNPPEPDNGPLAQDPLPDGMTVNVSGSMGTLGARVRARVAYGDSRVQGSDGCTTPVDREAGWGPWEEVAADAGNLRYTQGARSENNCGFLGAAVFALRVVPDDPNDPDWERLRGISTGNWSPAGGMTYADFDVEYEPLGETQNFTPRPTWAPVVDPQAPPEPLPEPVPMPRPRRRPMAPPPLPATPPDAVPVPQPDVNPNPQPIPNPGTNPVPQPQRFPSPTPRPRPFPRPVPAPTPNGANPLLNNGTPALPAAPEIVPTDPRARFPVAGGPNVTTTGPRASARNMALELGRIENKVDSLLSAGQGWNPDWLSALWALLALMELLQDWLDDQGGWPASEYTLTESCGNLADGEEANTRTVTTESAENIGEYLSNQFTAMAELTQAHLELRQPICKTRFEQDGQPVTVNFESDEVGPGGRAPLRKYFRYRCRQGTTLQELADHWREFSWQAGPIIVVHKGASWGILKVWASSEDEGRRVIRHAGQTSGVDPDRDGEWLTTTTDHSRYGQAGTMRVARRQGFLKVTTRDSPNGLPFVTN